MVEWGAPEEKRESRKENSTSVPLFRTTESTRTALKSITNFRSENPGEKSSEASNGHLKVTPWPESANELYWPYDHRLSAKLVPTFSDRVCRVGPPLWSSGQSS
jgi:hypothetical protein